MLFTCQISSVNPRLLWASMSDDLPNLAALATPLFCSTVDSVDAKRSFSIYNIILFSRKAKPESGEYESSVFLPISYNQFVRPDF
ncbi:hypothetical protein PoB_000372600 [Plakobranchus ocellatus]|uniref:Uncharacterized protein n=1 Tax=Plakobranchus ocellatus TaxID=259542 RepID=A0AAV3Y290_9GAST|nr:hypothetical protein PoB_000372600 [Plakobranchus ocellatus]